MKIAQIKNDFLNWRKLSSGNIAKYISFILGSIILICMFTFILFPNPFINTLLKDRITKAFAETYPAYSIKFGELNYNVWKNRLGCDSITLKSSDSAFTCNAASISVGGIGWIKILWKREFTLNDLASSVINAQKIVLNFRKSKEEVRIGMLNISVPDSEIIIDSINYHSSMNDEQFFAKSQFRQTRFRFDVPQIKILGLDYPGLLKGKVYNARGINIQGMFADILVNMDKPYDKSSTNPQMPNEFLSSMKEIVKLDSLKVTNGRLKYCERFALGATPGIVTFNKVNISVGGISNNPAYPDTAVVHAEGLFMNSAVMKLHMVMPLASKDFSLRYSGSLSTMDVTRLNSFIEPSEHQRIKSGVIQSANFNINVNSGYASGTLRVLYEDVSIAILNKDTGSEKGIFNRILSFFGKVFTIRGTNMPDKNGEMEIGEIKYQRRSDDYFIQFLWFSLRNGIAVVVGFPPT